MELSNSWLSWKHHISENSHAADCPSAILYLLTLIVCDVNQANHVKRQIHLNTLCMVGHHFQLQNYARQALISAAKYLRA